LEVIHKYIKDPALLKVYLMLAAIEPGDYLQKKYVSHVKQTTDFVP